MSSISWGQTTKFEKPRYLKHATLLCPIDITKSYDKEGLIGATTNSIKLTPQKKILKVNGNDAGVARTIEVEEIVNDTILERNILIEKGNAFEVAQQIGSYSIIKFWDLGKSTG